MQIPSNIYAEWAFDAVSAGCRCFKVLLNFNLNENIASELKLMFALSAYFSLNAFVSCC